MTTDPDLEEQHKRTMAELGILLDTALNPDGAARFCFCLLITEFDVGTEENPDARMSYISNATREDMLLALKEFIARTDGIAQEGDVIN